MAQCLPWGLAIVTVSEKGVTKASFKNGSVYSLDQIHLDHWTWTGPSNCQLDQNGVFFGPILVGPGNHAIYLITMAYWKYTCRSFS